jgi:hypothetical protein
MKLRILTIETPENSGLITSASAEYSQRPTATNQKAVRSGASHITAQHRAEVAPSNNSGGPWEYSVHEDAH